MSDRRDRSFRRRDHRRRSAPGRDLQRIVAPNPSALTGPARIPMSSASVDRHVVIDPGPDDPMHLDRILAAANGAVAKILCTHSHPDHSPGAAPLRAMTRRAGLRPRRHPDDGHQDDTYRPDHSLEDGDRFALPGATLRVAAYAGACLEPCLLPARGTGLAVHGRPPHEWIDGGDPAARRFDAALRGVAAAARATAAHGARARPRRRDARTARGDPSRDRASIAA